MKGFRDFFEGQNRKFQSAQAPVARRPINAEVIQVTEGCTFLDPVIEAAEVQRMINSHNLAVRNPSLNRNKSSQGRLRIKRTVFYTAYLVSQDDSSRLTQDLLSPILPFGLADSNDMKYMANSIMITPRPAPKSILEKAGGMGKKLSWQVTGTASFENKVWAARVAPIPPTENYYTENPLPLVVLAVRKGARPVDAGKIQNWHPVPAEKAMTIETVIGEKAVLRVEEDNPHEGEWESQFVNKGHKRRYQQERDEEILYPQTNQSGGYEAPPRGRGHNFHPYHRHAGDNRSHYDDTFRRGSHRGRGRGNNRGRGYSNRGARGRGRGRDGPSQPGYRSLDDYGSGYDGSHDEKGGGGGGDGYSMNY